MSATPETKPTDRRSIGVDVEVPSTLGAETAHRRLRVRKPLIQLRRSAFLLLGNVAESRGTLSWIAIVTATRLVLRGADPRLQRRLLQSASTNLTHLAHDPLNVLLTSVCFVASTNGYVTFLLGAVLISAPVERWLGLRRWLATVALGHIGATLVIALGLKVGVSAGWIDPSVRRAIDVGISYAMRGLAGALFFAIGHRLLRWLHLAVVLAGTLVPVVVSHTFTDMGHLVALTLGLLTGAFFHRNWPPLGLVDLERPILVYAPGAQRGRRPKRRGAGDPSVAVGDGRCFSSRAGDD